MSSIRQFLYTTMLALTTLSCAPTLASAQEPARGRFTLTHDVHWQNALVPAGSYQFSFHTDGFSLLTISKVTGTRVGFLFLVHDVDEAKTSDVNQILLQRTAAGSYVEAMQLPQFGMTLRFAVPSFATEKQVARAATVPPSSAR